MVQRILLPLLALLILPTLAFSEPESSNPTAWDIGLKKIVYSPEFESEIIKLTISQKLDSGEQTQTVSLHRRADIETFPFIYGKVMNQDRAFLKPTFISDSLYTWEKCEIWEPQAYKIENGSALSFRIVEPNTEKVRFLKFEFTSISKEDSQSLLVASL